MNDLGNPLAHPEVRFNSCPKFGDRGHDVKRAQEWLYPHGCATLIDADFGPATELCVRRFQAKFGLLESGVVSAVVQLGLLAPLIRATTSIEPGAKTLGALVVAYARRHLNEHPIEIGNENSGPWVRLYMDGKEGREWLWCAGFSSFLLRQAAQSLRITMPHPYAFGCDYLAGAAQSNGTFLRLKTAAEFASIKPGYLFLVPRTTTKWLHIGIVEAIQGEAMLTIEGNTNDSGSAEGFAVCRRTRGVKDKDYLIV